MFKVSMNYLYMEVGLFHPTLRLTGEKMRKAACTRLFSGVSVLPREFTRLLYGCIKFVPSNRYDGVWGSTIPILYPPCCYKR